MAQGATRTRGRGGEGGEDPTEHGHTFRDRRGRRVAITLSSATAFGLPPYGLAFRTYRTVLDKDGKKSEREKRIYLSAPSPVPKVCAKCVKPPLALSAPCPNACVKCAKGHDGTARGFTSKVGLAGRPPVG